MKILFIPLFLMACAPGQEADSPDGDGSLEYGDAFNYENNTDSDAPTGFEPPIEDEDSEESDTADYDTGEGDSEDEQQEHKTAGCETTGDCEEDDADD